MSDENKSQETDATDQNAAGSRSAISNYTPPDPIEVQNYAAGIARLKGFQVAYNENVITESRFRRMYNQAQDTVRVADMNAIHWQEQAKSWHGETLKFHGMLQEQKVVNDRLQQEVRLGLAVVRQVVGKMPSVTADQHQAMIEKLGNVTLDERDGLEEYELSDKDLVDILLQRLDKAVQEEARLREEVTVDERDRRLKIQEMKDKVKDAETTLLSKDREIKQLQKEVLVLKDNLAKAEQNSDQGPIQRAPSDEVKNLTHALQDMYIFYITASTALTVIYSLAHIWRPANVVCELERKGMWYIKHQLFVYSIVMTDPESGLLSHHPEVRKTIWAAVSAMPELQEKTEDSFWRRFGVSRLLRLPEGMKRQAEDWRKLREFIEKEARTTNETRWKTLHDHWQTSWAESRPSGEKDV
ncbi:hypothetical protein P153DRAFT_401644 [Dothidotthia symphoricarpi CBS 119687]|uniref:Uncharacterized protein n=1 Tax=Dothidotthia symphoricarpi CBS 119687 TaxID=1392245 RepID=A0A6A5ZY82_9PLEO|nr:uncharacterized protein P153DRAFT_401644 [Dothidotthia symphoricarpi CBS 119687]KAF2123737.1 hypothetical protein P153DRAFT_401644 [Dothidotthia symphoricarpi CBS 119687]